MKLTAHRQHKIYLVATMGFGLGSNEPDEVAFYNKVKKVIKESHKNDKKDWPKID